jgi:pSer/pThr/pTyr-binding forkhead associated (FHA) protein
MAELHACPKCSADVEVGHRFCGHCGFKMEVESPKVTGAALVRIHGGGADGARYELVSGEQTIGRTQGDISFPDDPFVSDSHAKLSFNGKVVIVDDLKSDNGVFVRIKGPVRLNVGDEFLAGEELLVLEEVPLAESFRDSEDTYFFGSVQPTTGLRIRQVLEGGYSGGGIMARGSMVTIGREDVEIEFPEDRFISGRHCALEFTPTGYTLTDLGSRNGTFVRLNSAATLSHGDFLFLGRQLLRVEVGTVDQTSQLNQKRADA